MHDDDPNMDTEVAFLKLAKAHEKVKPPKLGWTVIYLLPAQIALAGVSSVLDLLQHHTATGVLWGLMAVWIVALYLTERSLYKAKKLAFDLIQQTFQLCELNHAQSKEMDRMRRGF